MREQDGILGGGGLQGEERPGRLTQVDQTKGRRKGWREPDVHLIERDGAIGGEVRAREKDRAVTSREGPSVEMGAVRWSNLVVVRRLRFQG